MRRGAKKRNFILGGEKVPKKLTIIFFLMVLVLSLGLASSAYAADLNQCMNCHLYKAQPTAEVTKFVLPRFNDGSTTGSIVNKAVCQTCHWTDIGSQHFPTYKTVAVTVYGTTFGGFKSADSIYQTPATFHDLHNGPKRLVGSSCTRCHGVVSCSTCHNAVPHDGHYAGTGINPKTGSAITTPTLTVVNGSSTIQQSTTCAASECHQPLPNVVNRRTDGNDLCINCHNTDKTGHTDVSTLHTSTFPASLNTSPVPQTVDCSGCHNSVLSTEHENRGVDCQVCHSKTARDPVPTVIANANGVEANRECFKCHNNPPLKHAPVHIVNASNNNLSTPELHTDCNTCHTNPSVKSTIDAQVAATTPNYSCFDCHQGMLLSPIHVANYDATNKMSVNDFHPGCSSCHSKVDSTINTIAKTAPTSGYACADCHNGTVKGQLQPKHQANMTVGGAVYETTQFHPTCATCHTNANVAAKISVLKTQPSYACTECHDGSTAAKPGHSAKLESAGAAYDTTGYHPSCNTCHGNSQVSGKIAALKGTNGYLCSECHNGTIVPQANHSAKMSADGTLYTTTTLHPSCETCHNNATVKPTINSLKGQSGYLCDSCHTGSLQPNHQAKMSVSGAVYETTGYHPSCETCHGNEAVYPTISKLKGTTGYLCTDCHSTTGGAAAPGHQAKLTVGGAVYETTGYHPSCETCHSNPATKPVVSSLRGTTGYMCTECHNGTAAAQPSHQAKFSENSNPSDTTNIHPTCNTCHGGTRVAPQITALKGTSGYSCAECHIDIPQKHTSTLSDFPVNCTWCHSTQLLDTHTNPTVVNPNMVLNGTYTCETCHAQSSPVQNQIKLGMKNCLDCHNGTDVQAQHPDSQFVPRHDATGKFPTFLSQYSPQCADCHDSGAINLHQSIPAPKGPVSCVTCHTNNAYKPAVQSLNINCQGCHSANMEGEHVKYHATSSTVAPVKTPTSTTTGCLECHKVTDVVSGSVYTGLLDIHKKKPDSTVTCATCHGASARPEAKQAIAANNTNCEACHVGGGGHQHNVTTFETTTKVNCAECHATDPATKSTELTKLHKDRGFGCETCHNTTFEGGSNPVIVKDGMINLPTCSTCHDGTKAPLPSTQHEGTQSSHGTATGFGTYNDSKSQGADCASCHTSKVVSEVHVKLACDSCHTSGVTAVKNVIQGNWSRAATKSGYTCADCHNALPVTHAPEHQAVNNIETQDVTCSKCHSFNAPVAQVTGVTTVHTSNGCNTCHTSSVPAIRDFIGARTGQVNTPAYNCNDCHSQLPKKHNKLHVANAYLSSGDSAQCASCHNTLDVSVLHKNVAGGTSNCDKCHASSDANVNKVINDNLSTIMTRPGFTCDSCHTSVKDGGHQHPVTTFATTASVSCAQCHSTDPVAKTTELSKLHADRNVTCSGCHNATFEGGPNPVIVRDGVVKVPACATCHDGTKAPKAEVAYPDHDNTSVATHTYASSFGTYTLAGNVNCAGCHTTMNIRPVHQAVACDKCHTSTETAVKNVIEGNWSRTNTKVSYSCADCHNAVTTAATTNHKPAHTVTSFTYASGDVENCNSCHNTMVITDLHVGKVNKAGVTMTCDSCHNSADAKILNVISQQARSATPSYSCDSCHTLHGNGDHNVTLPVGLAAEPNLKCAQCHDNDPASAGVTDLAGEHTRRVNAATGQNYTCSTCHNSAKAEVRTAISTKNKNCSACHTQGWHNDLNTPHTSNYVTNPAFQCSNCHGNVLSATSLHPNAIAGTTTIGGGPVSYKIFRGTDGVNFIEVATSSTNSFSNTGLTANTKYYYQVAAVDQAGNVSTKSNVAFATAAVQETTTTVNPTAAAYSNQSNNGDSSSDGGFSSLSPSVLTRLTDGKDSTGGSYDVRVEENGSSDRWIYVRVNQDAKNATKVVLNIRASWRDRDDKGNFLIYPYQSNGTSINTSGVVNYSISRPSYNGNFTNYSIDVTAAAHTMDNFGFMKFRIKPGNDGSRREAYISEVDYVITSDSATTGSGTLPGDPGTSTITGTGGDSTPPSTPANLTAQGISSSQIDLNWTASTDPAQTVNQTGQSNCLRCHDSTQSNVQSAIVTRNTNCDACHTVHGDPALLHNSTYVLNPTMDCAKCHQSRVDNEHLSRKSPTTGQQYTCDTCHKSTDPLVQGAIVSNNTKCDACHVTRHTNVQSVHVSNYFKDTTVVCENCHNTTKTEFTGATLARHAIPGTTSLAEGGSYVSPWTKTSTTNCRDCHNDTNGTYYGKLLVANYTTTSANLCFKCHTQSTYTSTNSGSNFTYHAKHAKYGSCQICHSTKPHGQSTNKHFIVLKGQAGAASNNTITKFIHRTGGYSKSDCSAGCTGDHP